MRAWALGRAQGEGPGCRSREAAGSWSCRRLRGHAGCCKPLLALLCADSPSLSHLFPFLSPPTCLPPCSLAGSSPDLSHFTGAPGGAEMGGSLYLGWRNFRYHGACHREMGWLKGSCSAAPHLPRRTSPPLPGPSHFPPSVTARGSGGRQGRKEGISGGRKRGREVGAGGGWRVWSNEAGNLPLILPQIPPFRHNSCKFNLLPSRLVLENLFLTNSAQLFRLVKLPPYPCWSFVRSPAVTGAGAFFLRLSGFSHCSFLWGLTFLGIDGVYLFSIFNDYMLFIKS